MRLRTITARTVADALAKVEEELGDDALVLETRTVDGGAEVVAAAVEREEPSDGLMRLRAEVALLRRELGILVPPSSALAPAAAPTPRVNDRFAPIEARLVRQGLEPALLDRFLTMIERAPESEGDPIDPARSEYCRNALAGLLPGVGPPGAGRARCFAFVGPSGAGKSTTLAKLAEQSGAGGPRLGLVSLDGGRPGGTEVLARTAERLKLPFAEARGPQGLLRALESIGTPDRILVDTAGLGPRESAALHVLREKLRGAPIGVHLVLPANLEAESLARAALSFRELRPSAIVFTKLYETERLVSLINLPAALDLPVAALAHGPSLRGDLTPASRPLIADLVLGRRRPLGGRDG
ncbi:MAG: hypothetical protein ACF8XB_20490 [Planctomycetota bacterium JB042]